MKLDEAMHRLEWEGAAERERQVRISTVRKVKSASGREGMREGSRGLERAQRGLEANRFSSGRKFKRSTDQALLG